MKVTKQKWYRILLLVLAVLLASPALACEPPAPAEFEVVSLDIAPQEVAPGEDVIITAEVTNVGGRKGTHTVTLRVGRSVLSYEEDTRTVEVAPRRGETVTFRMANDDPGLWRVSVDGMRGTIRVLRPAEFRVATLGISPQVVGVGEIVTVTADVTNAGEIEGDYSAALIIDGRQVEVEQVTLAPGAAQSVGFTFAQDATGTYSVEVGGLSGLLVVSETGDALTALAATYPELYEELLKLPDLKEIDDRDREAVEDIASLALNPKYEEAFEAMLNEGIKGKRKYCSPLEALLWVAYDRELNGYYPLRPYKLGKLANDAWKNTTTSESYASERWQDFDEVVDRLNSPMLVREWVNHRLRYDYSRVHLVQTPEATFDLTAGVCRHAATLATECLLSGGYTNVKNLTVNWGGR